MQFRMGHRTMFLALALAAAIGLCSLPAYAGKQSISKVDVEDLAEGVQIAVTTSAPLSFYDRLIGNRIVFDLYGSLASRQQTRVKISSGGIYSVSCVWYKDSPPVARIVVSTDGLRQYSVRSENGGRLTTIEVQKAGAAAKPNGAKPLSAISKPAKSSACESASKSTAPPAEAEPEAITEAEPVLVASTVPIVPQLVQAVAPAPKLVSLDFVASDVHDVLKALAVQGGVNIAAGPDVKGEVTVSLNDVTVEEALRLVTSLSGFKFDRVSGSYVVGTKDNLRALAASTSGDEGQATDVVVIRYADPTLVTSMLESRFDAVMVNVSAAGSDASGAKGQTVLVLTGPGSAVQSAKALVEATENSVAESVAQTIVELYEVKYADVTELSALLASAIRGLVVGTGPSQGFNLQCPSAVAMGSDSGSASSSPGAPVSQAVPPKVLILQGTSAEIDRAKELLAKVDVPQPQILIEAKVIDITEDGSKSLGIDWGDEGVIGEPTFTEQRNPPSQALSVGRFTRTGISVQARLRALVEDGKGKILANPNVLALDGKPASVFIGDEIKYVIRVDRTPEGTNVETDTARVGVQLHTISRISSDGYITMNLHPEVSMIRSWIDTPAGLKLPEISRRFVDSTIRVKDGETIVIGGLIKDEELKTTSGIPILKDLPIIGELFKFRTSSKTHSEIIMFITPRILVDS